MQVLHMKDKLSDDATSNNDLMRASELTDQWRRSDFYVEFTDKVYRKWRPRLEEMYKDRVDWKDVGKIERKRAEETMLFPTSVLLNLFPFLIYLCYIPCAPFIVLCLSNFFLIHLCGRRALILDVG